MTREPELLRPPQQIISAARDKYGYSLYDFSLLEREDLYRSPGPNRMCNLAAQYIRNRGKLFNNDGTFEGSPCDCTRGKYIPKDKDVKRIITVGYYYRFIIFHDNSVLILSVNNNIDDFVDCWYIGHLTRRKDYRAERNIRSRSLDKIAESFNKDIDFDFTYHFLCQSRYPALLKNANPVPEQENTMAAQTVRRSAYSFLINGYVDHMSLIDFSVEIQNRWALSQENKYYCFDWYEDTDWLRLLIRFPTDKSFLWIVQHKNSLNTVWHIGKYEKEKKTNNMNSLMATRALGCSLNSMRDYLLNDEVVAAAASGDQNINDIVDRLVEMTAEVHQKYSTDDGPNFPYDDIDLYAMSEYIGKIATGYRFKCTHRHFPNERTKAFDIINNFCGTFNLNGTCDTIKSTIKEFMKTNVLCTETTIHWKTLEDFGKKNVEAGLVLFKDNSFLYFEKTLHYFIKWYIGKYESKKLIQDYYLEGIEKAQNNGFFKDYDFVTKNADGTLESYFFIFNNTRLASVNHPINDATSLIKIAENRQKKNSDVHIYDGDGVFIAIFPDGSFTAIFITDANKPDSIYCRIGKVKRKAITASR